jgi:hemerythrin-like domain-containing protein
LSYHRNSLEQKEVPMAAEGDKQVPTRLADEHREINQTADALDALTNREDAVEAYSEWRSELRETVERFADLLESHFEHEEEGGFLRDVLREVPNSEASVRTLKQEHGEIKSAMAALLGDLGATRHGGEDDVRRIRTAVQGITSTLHHHELSEQQLIQRTYYREYGGGD